MPEPHKEEEVREAKRAALLASGLDVYPSETKKSHEISEVRASFKQLQKNKIKLIIAGRVMAFRKHGGSTFLRLSDGTADIQCFLKRDEIGESEYKALEFIDIGDFLECRGTLMTTQKGEQTLLLNQGPSFLAKALLPLPEKWHGLQDIEIRHRKRYLDLLVNNKAKETALMRTSLVSGIRKFLDDKGYLEVETPILQAIPGGATAKPFQTRLNALDLDLYLRIAPELYLKRLVVAGFPKVYEVARCFRNEGMDHSHNPEFTQIELYEAYFNYKDYMKLVEELFSKVVIGIVGSQKIKFGNNTLNLSPPFKVLDWTKTLDNALGLSTEELNEDKLKKALEDKGVEMEAGAGRGAMLDAAYKKMVRPSIVQPTFLIDHPIELSPLAKPHKMNSKRAERFQLVLGGGIELLNGYSELNDPILQKQRFEEQEKLRQMGDDEAQRIDEDYLEALRHGLPPTAGLGIGIDRLAQIMTDNDSIKEVILFPTLRPKNE